VHSNISAFHQVENFLLSLTEANEDGRVLLTSELQPKDTSSGNKLSLRYILLNPAEHFASVVQEARSIVLAGGTMAPVSEVAIRLVLFRPADSLAIHRCETFANCFQLRLKLT